MRRFIRSASLPSFLTHTLCLCVQSRYRVIKRPVLCLLVNREPLLRLHKLNHCLRKPKQNREKVFQTSKLVRQFSTGVIHNQRTFTRSVRSEPCKQKRSLETQKIYRMEGGPHRRGPNRRGPIPRDPNPRRPLGYVQRAGTIHGIRRH